VRSRCASISAGVIVTTTADVSLLRLTKVRKPASSTKPTSPVRKKPSDVSDVRLVLRAVCEAIRTAHEMFHGYPPAADDLRHRKSAARFPATPSSWILGSSTRAGRAPATRARRSGKARRAVRIEPMRLIDARDDATVLDNPCDRRQ
jgi:hypothetical protein